MRIFTGLLGGTAVIAGAILLAFTGVTPDTMTVPAFSVPLPTTFDGFLPATFDFAGFVMSNPFLMLQQWAFPEGMSHQWFMLLATLGWLGLAVGSLFVATWLVSIFENPHRYSAPKKRNGEMQVIDWG